MATQFVHVQANLNSFQNMLRMVVFVTHSYAALITTVLMEFVAMVNAQLLAEIKTIALMVNIVRIIDAKSNVQVTINAQMVKHANKAHAQLDAEVIQIVARIYRAIITIVKIHAITTFADRMLCAKSKIMQPNANVRPDLMQIQPQNKVAFVFQRHAFQRADARTDTCALQTYAKCLAPIQLHVQLGNDATIMYARKFVTRTTTVCQEKFVMSVERVSRVVQLKPIAHQRKCVQMENVNVDAVLLEHHLVAQILMNVQNKFVTKAQFVKIHPDHSNVFAQSKQLVIHTQHQVVCCQINVLEMKIVPRIWLALKENVPNHAISLNADAMHFVKQANIKRSVNVHRVILVIQLINSPDASESNVLAAKNAVKINTVIHKSTNVKIHAIMLIVVGELVLLVGTKQHARAHRATFF